MTRFIKLLRALPIVCLFAARAHAQTSCARLPEEVESYVASQAGWSVVSLSDLVEDDVELWKEYHDGLCPGATEVNLNGHNEFAVTLIRKGQRNYIQKLVLLNLKNGVLQAKELVKATETPSPEVIWTAPPGEYSDIETGEKVHTRWQSLIFVKLEAAAIQFFYQNGKLRTLTAAD